MTNEQKARRITWRRDKNDDSVTEYQGLKGNCADISGGEWYITVANSKGIVIASETVECSQRQAEIVCEKGLRRKVARSRFNPYPTKAKNNA